ncbi:MAG: tRNA (guanosine(46)-N7)-methyltransferase TrmB [Planctomycetota bacterium]|nr:tRNA (guanosine(46)-N7)-methyltransferase TrmB [Planctomycetota bacterium]MEE3180545.1 tRNA (guanosine(46)-N7)-methyltransferase TrmB [Planctomycetota bacterium]
MRKLPAIESDYLLRLEKLPGYGEKLVRWEEVFEQTRPLRIEVGVGNSPFLIEVAGKEPDYNYLGLEYSHKRVMKFLKKVEVAGFKNIRMLHLNSDLLFSDYIAPAGIEHLFVNFPDPWPKRRHGKKRFIAGERLAAAAKLLAPGGGFSLRTDARDYALEARENLEANEDLENRFPGSEWAPEPLYPFETPYEIKFKAQGLRIYYFEYRKRQAGAET